MPEPKANSGRGKLGIVAGQGELPVRLIQACRAQRRDYVVIAIKEQTPPETVEGEPHLWIRLGSAISTLPAIAEYGVRELVMAGSIRRPTLFSLWPDCQGIRFLIRTGALMRGDDGLLKAVVRMLEREGFRVVAPDDILPSALAKAGAYGARTPDDAALSDIAVGVTAAKALGARDVGQGVVVRGGVVIGEEDKKGTDALLARVPEGQGGVLVKVAKPGQEMRADLPTVGVTTVQGVARAGLAGIAIEVGRSLVIDADAVARAADAAGVFVVGVEEPQAESGG